MLDQKTKEVARQLIHPQLAERREPFALEIGNFKDQMVKHGALQSSGSDLGLGQLANAEIKIRVRIVTANLFRVVYEGRLPYSPNLAADLMQEIEIHAREAQIAVSSATMPHVGRRGLEGRVAAGMEEARVRALDLAKGEVGAFCHRLAATESAPTARPGVTVNVGGNVGAVMTGDYATANVVQHFGSEEKEIVERALVAVREYVTAQGNNIPELTEVVDEAEVELKKPASNLIRLRGLLSGIATTIQTAAAAQPAYALIKDALAVLGIGG